MTRIAFISTMTGSAWGGSEDLWYEAALRLASQPGVDVSVCAARPHQPSPQLAALAKAGCHVHNIWATHRFQAATKKFILPQLARWLQRLRPDLVVISQGSPVDAPELLQFCQQNSQRYAAVVQAANDTNWPDDEIAAPLAEAYRRASAVYFVSQGNQALVQRQLAATLPNAVVVRNPFKVPYDVAMPWPEENGVWRLASVARLHPASKGQDILFEVLRQDRWRQRPLRITLFGSGPQEQTLRRLAEAYGLEQVVFGGFTPDVTAIWAAHHALILPSRSEGLPLALVEAMLCARPAIVTDVAGNTELVEDNATGFVAAAPTVALFDEALERAWQRRTDWSLMGRLAAQRVRQQVPCDPGTVFAQEILEAAGR